MAVIDIGHGVTLVNQATGYGVIVGMGVLFTIIILAAVKIQKMYLMEDSGKSEMFMVANRSVGTGLTASAVFSSWMWIDETVFSCTMCYSYGLGPVRPPQTGVSRLGGYSKTNISAKRTFSNLILYNYCKYI